MHVATSCKTTEANQPRAVCSYVPMSQLLSRAQHNTKSQHVHKQILRDTSMMIQRAAMRQGFGPPKVVALGEALTAENVFLPGAVFAGPISTRPLSAYSQCTLVCASRGHSTSCASFNMGNMTQIKAAEQVKAMAPVPVRVPRSFQVCH
jgi:hypothetical protein